jgi:hypothetical protein
MIEYLGLWWQIYILIGGVLGIPLEAYYVITEPDFRVEVRKTKGDNVIARAVLVFIMLLMLYPLFILVWPLCLLAFILNVASRLRKLV